ncbi:MAG: class I SAM-dependent rRNA methyltransferase [Chitinispirillaceae bacterium]|jgi:23S rRNA (cytosine1962-C5)-methyltransferase
MLKIYLKKGREKPVQNGHPWIFSGAIQKIEGNVGPGVPCIVIGNDGTILGQGYYNAKSSITVRMLTRGDEPPFTGQLLRERLERAVSVRAPVIADSGTDSCRLVNAEGDFLPGLVVDRYAGGLVVQIGTAGMERMRGEIMATLCNWCAPEFVYERSDTESREREGMLAEEGLRSGTLPEPLVIKENGIKFIVDLSGGQKTGFYFDQRNNRLLARAYANVKHCLDCFSYSGAFGLNLLAGFAASITAVDISKNTAAWYSKNMAINGFDASRTEYICADAFDYLRAAGRRYDLIILDPPKFAKHPSDVPNAARGYKDINLVAMKKILPGGILFTFSCSNAVDARLFRQIIFAAAVDAGREAQLLHILSAGPDHPVSMGHPEGEYLKGLVMRIY